MCLLIYKPKGTAPDWEDWEDGFTHNPDGGGFAVVTDGQVCTSKGYNTWGQFRKGFEPFADDECIVHFRIATHGATDYANCHPFDVGGIHGHTPFAGQCAMAHNGVLEVRQERRDMSDTWHFARDILYPLWKHDPGCFKDDVIRKMLERMIGRWNKVAILTPEFVTIVNEDAGHWKDGAWYSNLSHQWGGRYGYYDDCTTAAWPSDNLTQDENGLWRYTTKPTKGQKAPTLRDMADTDVRASVATVNDVLIEDDDECPELEYSSADWDAMTMESLKTCLSKYCESHEYAMCVTWDDYRSLVWQVFGA